MVESGPAAPRDRRKPRLIGSESSTMTICGTPSLRRINVLCKGVMFNKKLTDHHSIYLDFYQLL